MVVKEIHRRFIDYAFFWQHSFYDHVIGVEESFEKIREYILNNPLKWDFDRNNPNRKSGRYYFNINYFNFIFSHTKTSAVQVPATTNGTSLLNISNIHPPAIGPKILPKDPADCKIPSVSP